MRGWFFSLVLGVMLPGVDASAMPLRQSLAMFESGATVSVRSEADSKRGGAGEVSRFQILPEVWRQYSRSTDYENPELAWTVAQRILADRTRRFREATGREPNSLELYLLWNKPGSFEAVGYAAKKVKIIYRQRAERFANLHDRR